MEPERDILVLTAHAHQTPLNAHADISTVARGLNFGMSLHLHIYFMHAINEGSGEPVQLHISPEPSLFENAIITLFSCAGVFRFNAVMCVKQLKRNLKTE